MIYHIKVHTGESMDVDPDLNKLPFDFFYMNHTKYGFSLKRQYYSPEIRALLFAEYHFNEFDGVFWVLKDFYNSLQDIIIQPKLTINV